LVEIFLVMIFEHFVLNMMTTLVLMTQSTPMLPNIQMTNCQ
jgi:hypothetical protein